MRKLSFKFIGIIIAASCFYGCGNSLNSDKNTLTDSLESKSETVPHSDSLKVVTSDSYFNTAYHELVAMLDGVQDVDYKRAVFLMEWAHSKGELSYEKFCMDIRLISDNLKRFIKAKGIEHYKTAGNYALFEFFTQPNYMNGNLPYTYDFDDFTGSEDPTKLFVTKLIATHKGQCRSLPTFYKILAEEIGTEAFIAQAPNHLYIKHLGEDNRWVNVELTNGSLSTDAHIISTLFISAEAIYNRVYMEPLTLQQSIALILDELGGVYQMIYGYDEFILECSRKSLEYYPTNMAALLRKNNAILQIAFNFGKGRRVTSKDHDNPYFAEWKATHDRINELGFREMPRDAYAEWVRSVETEIERQADGDNT